SDLDLTANHGNYDAWVVNIKEITLAAEDVSISPVQISPNPTNGLFTISTPDYRDSMIVVRNVLGQQVYSSRTGGFITVDLSSRPNGVYTVSLHTHDGVRSSLLVKE